MVESVTFRNNESKLPLAQRITIKAAHVLEGYIHVHVNYYCLRGMLLTIFL